MANGVFRSFNKESRPLSFHLEQRFTRPLLRQVEALPPEDLQEDTAVLTRRLIDQIRVNPPQLLGQERADVREGKQRPSERPGASQMTTRYYVAVQVVGDVDVLEHWPNEAGSELRPVDHDLGDWTNAPWRVGDGDYDLGEEMRRHEALLAQDRWAVRLRSDDGSRALYTFVDLTDEERQQVEAGQRDLAAEVDTARQQIEPIVAAIAEQVAQFFDQMLPERLTTYIENRKRQWSAHHAVLRNLSWPTGWRYAEPTVEPDDPSAGGADDARGSPLGVGDGDPGRAADTTKRPTEGAAAQDIHLGQPTRLSDASFVDLLRTMRVWADAVERHPVAYRGLPEERVSDLLVATLNAALPGAHREVYNRGGKSDFYVRADTLATGAAPTRVFIGESKKWTGPRDVDDALAQLFRYLTAHDTAAALLFLVPLVDGDVARSGAMRVLQNHPDYAEAASPAVEGWPILHFDTGDKRVRVCVAFVDLPPHD